MRSTIACAAIMLASTLGAQVLPEPPQEYIDVCYPATPNSITVCASGCDYTNSQLQQAINAAAPGTTILLQPGHTYPAAYTLPAKNGDDWIVIRTDVPDAQLPPADQRIDPSYAGALARFQAPANQSALTFQSNAHHYYLMGLEVTSTGYTSDIIRVGDGTQSSVDALPHDIVLDRLYIHGDAALGSKRGVMLNSARTAIVNCHISDCKSTSQDAQAICGWNGPGPFRIVNNRLEASGENVMFGGANPAIQDLVPSDIEVRNNHFFKPLSWKEGDPSYAGTPWCVKNILELKNAQRMLVEGNILENNWSDCQSGFAIVFTPRTQSGASMWCRVTDITWRYNILQNSDGGFNISGHDDQLDNPVSTRILIEHNLAYDLSSVNKLYQFLNGTEHLTIRHNTSINAGTTTSAAGDPTLYLTFQDNICGYGSYGVCGTGTGCGNATINAYFPGATFSHNVLIGTPGGPNGNPANYPPNHWFPAGVAAVGFADPMNNDYHLLPSSSFSGAGSDGTDIGADIDSLDQFVAQVLPGIWPSCTGISTLVSERGHSDALVLFPNPARDAVSLQCDRSRPGDLILLRDALGRVIRAARSTGERTMIDLTGVSGTLFTVQILSADGRSRANGRLMLAP